MEVDKMPSLSLVADEPFMEGCCISPLKRSMEDSVFDHLNYKRQKQTDLDDTSSDISVDGNEEDVYLDIVFLNKDLDYLKKIQRLNAEFAPNNKFLAYRGQTIHYMSGVCRSLALKSLTLHRAVNYLDRLMGSEEFPTSLFRLAASACILVAAKFEEHPSRVPRIDQMTEMISGMGSKDQLLAAEKLLLQKLNWNASCATHLHFSQCFMHHGVSHIYDTRHGKPLSSENLNRITYLMERIATGVCLPGRPSSCLSFLDISHPPRLFLRTARPGTGGLSRVGCSTKHGGCGRGLAATVSNTDWLLKRRDRHVCATDPVASRIDVHSDVCKPRPRCHRGDIKWQYSLSKLLTESLAEEPQCFTQVRCACL
eukprot:748780-Hanusia_phi.AAC.2